MVDPYPLLLEPLLKTKVWGGRRLADYGKSIPHGTLVGESWEVADLDATMPSGGGGGAARSVIVNGPMAGHTLHEALQRWGAGLVGERWGEADEFPLLVKLIDAREHLSVQVHPTPEYAAAHPDAHVKTESWFIIEAEPGARLYLGLQAHVDQAALRRAVSEGRVPDVLRAVPAVAGECHHLPSGTVHALGAGVLVAEVQSPSDTTFRLYDWTTEYGRHRRELHVEAALESIVLGAPPSPVSAPSGGTPTDLVATDRYVLRAVSERSSVPLQPATCTIVMCVGDAAAITHGEATVSVRKGSTVVVPASISASTSIAAAGSTVLLAELAT
jgi:mannose-6-phosphate isomerase